MAKNSEGNKPGFHTWEQRHSDLLARGIIEIVKSHRVELYRLPGLADDEIAADNHLEASVVRGKRAGGKGESDKTKGTPEKGKKRKADESNERDSRVAVKRAKDEQ